MQQPGQQDQQQQQQQQRPGSSDGPSSSQAGLGFGAGSTGLGLGVNSSHAGLGLGSTAGLGAGGGSSSGGGGLGFRSGGSTGGSGGLGLGFKSAGSHQEGSAAVAADHGGSSSGMLRHHQQQQQDEDLGADDEDVVLPTAFGRRIKEAAEKKVQQKAAQQKAASDRLAARHADPKFATFEQHTKGIGMKLLEKMGFQAGKGLGRSKQGIAKPVEAKLRPKGMGLGHGEFRESKMEVERPKAKVFDADAAELEQELAEAKARTQVPLWKIKAAPIRQKRTYKTAEEVLEEAAADGGTAATKLAAQPILDLRGPQARLVTDLEQLNAAAGDGTAADAAAGPPMPELHHNMSLLVSLTESQLRRFDASLQHQQDTAALLVQEKERLEKEVAAAAAASQRLHALTAQLQAVQSAPTGSISLDQLQAEYASMAASYPEEYVLYSLPAAALSQVLPLLGQLLAGWQPLVNPSLGVEQIQAWKGLLESEGSRQAVLGSWEDTEDPYGMLVMELVMPPIRTAISHWEPRHPEPLLAWLDLWRPLLPRGAAQQLLQGLILPRIAAAVESWDPTRETQPIHAWVHPWLPYLATELSTVYPTIRHRLTRALTAWHASDGSARLLLAPWQAVFEPQDWEALLQRSILPKLAQALQTELMLNPNAPHLDPFQWAISWHGVMPTGHLAALMESSFFPAWHAILHHWLSHSPNYDEVTKWYLEWKGMFPQDVLDHPRVRSGFAQGLNMMNSAAEGRPLPAAAPAAAPVGAVPSWRSELGADGAAAPPAAAAGRTVGAGIAVGEPSLKELVTRYAEEQGVEFVPRAGRLHDGLPVYSYGGVNCVVDAAKSLIRAQLRDKGWVPVSLEKLSQEALSRK
eukprot:GHUV01019364.1.p1 GENE.GHUV01019364.1~~GHUV01019364.1.p1  ORF type:complete len:861 (+),score=252.13 GHUV01019364.1:619-3201(+)